MPSQVATVEQYLASLPEDRRVTLCAVRDVIRQHLDPLYEEGMQYGMVGYYVPHSVFPEGYHADPKQPLPFVALASQKSHMALYLMGVYTQPEEEQWFRDAWAKTGKKLDMGKSCVRFKTLDAVALEVLGEAIRRVPVKDYLAHYTSVIRPPAKKPAAKKPAAKKRAAPKE